MKRVLTIQDISCVGQCSLTVALPIISSFGIETSIIPTAILSNHTMFKDFSFLDLTEEMPKIKEKWINQEIYFDGLYTGYIGSKKQIDYIIDIMNTCLNKDSIIVVDPCMADFGKLYPGFDDSFPQEMLKLCKKADYIVPNLTEACLLLNKPYSENYSKEELEDIVYQLYLLTNANIVLTGMKKSLDTLGCVYFDKNSKKFDYYFTKKVDINFHGTGDCFASSFFGSLIKGYSLKQACKVACEFTYLAVCETKDYVKEHWYGVYFEKALKYIVNLDENV